MIKELFSLLWKTLNWNDKPKSNHIMVCDNQFEEIKDVPRPYDGFRLKVKDFEDAQNKLLLICLKNKISFVKACFDEKDCFLVFEEVKYES